MKLRELLEKDVPFMLEWMHDQEINRYFQFNAAAATFETAANFIKSSKNDPDNRHYAIVDDDDEYLGTISLKEIDNRNKRAEYAISTRRKAHGRGVAAWATHEILNIAFNQLQLNRVYLNVLCENEQANRFYHKFGFIFEGTSSQHIFLKDNFMDLNWYAMTKSQWEVRVQK